MKNLYFLISLHAQIKTMDTFCFSANVRQCNIVSDNEIVLLFQFMSLRCLFASQSSGYLIKRIYASGWFVLPVGLYFRLVCVKGKCKMYTKY